MKGYINRFSEERVLKLASYFPVVGIVGPRQVGKTSLAQGIRQRLEKPSIYLDLENPADLVKLENPSLFLDPLADKTVILDEVQKVPDLFPVLRGIIDRNRTPGRFILLGSASPELIRDSSESLAGRIAYLELTPFTSNELPQGIDFQTHWFRGGFPDSLFAPDEELASLWRRNFIQTYLEKDLPLLGMAADPVLSGKLWRMIAHLSGQLLNMEMLARSLGISGATIGRYLDFLESAYLIRRLPPFHANLKKRLVKSPKLYLRDTGILHQLLGIPSFMELNGHPVIGASWETYVIEQLLPYLPGWAELYFYRTHHGAEVDLVIAKAGQPVILLEIKYSTTPKVTKGLRIVQEDLRVDKCKILAPVDERFFLAEDIEVINVDGLESLF
jgi:predicted AAA+ superfamily ATPase